MYLTFDEFKDIYPETEMESQEFERLERRAESDIDRLTFNRITACGFEMLSDFQKSIVRRSVALQMNFISDYSDLLDSPLSAYSVSGISMSFDSEKVFTVGGVTTTNEVYGLMMQTGLCYRGIRE